MSPNTSACRPDILSLATGRVAVRAIRRSMSRSSQWLRALAPPEASAPPRITVAMSPAPGSPSAASTMPPNAVTSSSDMTFGFVKAT